MPNMETNMYSTSQQELYKISRLGWRSFSNYLPDFTQFNPFYNKVYVNHCIAEVDAAEISATEQVYNSITEDKLILLTHAVDSCLIKWQNLKRYVLNAYNAKHITTMLNAAGQLFYKDASNYDWQSVGLLIDGASAFIKNHKADLVANENMPPNFGNSFDETMVIFINLQAKFFGTITLVPQYMQNKLKATNTIYEKLTRMFLDAQQIFINNESVSQLFDFDNLKAVISGMNKSGIRGFITDAETGFPIVAATISPANHAFVTISEHGGHYYLKLLAGSYLITVSANGYASKTKTVIVKHDMVSLLNVNLSGVLVKSVAY